MKSPTATTVNDPRARAALREMLKSHPPETVASRIGCSLRSVDSWRTGGRISRLSAQAILAASRAS